MLREGNHCAWTLFQKVKTEQSFRKANPGQFWLFYLHKTPKFFSRRLDALARLSQIPVQDPQTSLMGLECITERLSGF